MYSKHDVSFVHFAVALVCIFSHLAGLTNAMCSTPPTDAPRVLKLFLESSGTYWNNVAFCHAMGGEPIAAKSSADNDAYAATINSAVAASSVPSTVGSAFHFGLEESPLDSGVWKWHFDEVVLDTMCHYAEFANTMGHGCLALDATRANGSRWVADGDCTSSTPRYGCNFYPSLPACTIPMPLYPMTGYSALGMTRTYDNAKQYCWNSGQGELAYFYKQGDVDNAGFMPPGPVDGMWIGLKYNASIAKYVWSSGETMEHCHQVSLWEPDPMPTSGEMCYVLQYDSAYGKWRYRQRDCVTGTAGGAVCRVPLCGYLPATPACMTTNYMGMFDDMIMGAVMNYTCMRNTSVVFQTVCQNGTATWSANPTTFVCPPPPACPTAAQSQQFIKAFPFSSGSWKPADRLCRALGGSLVIARNRTENDLLQSAIDQAKADYPSLAMLPYWEGVFHLGIRYEGVGNYSWVDGVPFLPDCNNVEMGCYSVRRDCVVFDSVAAPGSRWSDMTCTNMSTVEIYTACQSNTTFPSCSANSTNGMNLTYIPNLTPMTRAAAADYCTSVKGVLASFHSEAELAAAVGAIGGGDQFWMGLRFNYTTNIYEWDDGKSLGWCDPIRIWEPMDTTNESAMGTGKDCFKAEYDPNLQVWRFKQELCSATVAATMCQAVLCPDPPMLPNAKSNHTGGVGQNSIDSVVSYKCLWTPLSFTTTCQNNGSWLPSPAMSITCPPWVNSSATMECFHDQSLANLSAILSSKPNPTSAKKCSAICVKDLSCQGIYLKPIIVGTQNEISRMPGQESSAKDDNFQCQVFSLGYPISSADMTGQLGSKVCRHVYRDTLM